MKNKKPAAPPKPGEFKQASHSLSDLGPDALASLLCAAVDVTLVLDDSGTILDVAYGDELLAAELGDAWVGQRWIDTVTEDSHPKVRALLAPPAPGAMRWRQINQSVPEGGTMCTQCVNVYARKGVVPPALKLRKQAEVDRRQAFLQRVAQGLGLVCGGMGQVFRGQTVLGAVVGLVFLFFVGLVVLRSGVVRPEWDGLSPVVRVLVAAPFGLLIWAWSWRRLSQPSEGH